ncbi:20303_t:CDS:2 [Entrophospora sp. SA101]|nr:20303_t:CDS:2 [Entrophospora sp. SA101]
MSDPIPNDTEAVTFAVTEEQGKTVLLLLLIQSTASLIATTFGISLFFSIRYKYPRLVNRVTFRLAIATMISDFGVGVSQLIGSTLASPTGPSCTIAIWGTVFFSLMSIFFPACIALNLQIMFIHEYRGRLLSNSLWISASLETTCASTKGGLVNSKLSSKLEINSSLNPLQNENEDLVRKTEACTRTQGMNLLKL